MFSQYINTGKNVLENKWNNLKLAQEKYLLQYMALGSAKLV